MKRRRTRYVVDPARADDPLVRQHDLLIEREAALAAQLTGWAGNAQSRLFGQYVTGFARALRTSVQQSRVIRERKRLEGRMAREGVMIPDRESDVARDDRERNR